MNNSNLLGQLTAPTTVGSGDLLAGSFCDTCKNWEPDKTGLRPYRRGYCPIFDKKTDAIHGYQCTAYESKTTA